MAKYLALVGGRITEVSGTASSAGAGDAGEIPQLDGAGRLDSSMMPVGIGADTASITASEALAAGDFVNIWDSSGAKVRKADASAVGKEAHGFVLSTVSNGATATVYFEGTNTQVTSQTPGVVYLSAATAGRATSTPPSAAGNIVQSLGFATGSTAINFQSSITVTLA
jgi:hypothetical protein